MSDNKAEASLLAQRVQQKEERGDKSRKKASQGQKGHQQKTNKFKPDSLNFPRCAWAWYQSLFLLVQFQSLLLHFSPCLSPIAFWDLALRSLPYIPQSEEAITIFSSSSQDLQNPLSSIVVSHVYLGFPSRKKVEFEKLYLNHICTQYNIEKWN